MGYERNDRYGGHQGDRPRDYDRERDRYSYGAREHGSRGYDQDDRGFFERAGDEVRSWFGDEEAERRRRLDERYEETEGRRYDRERFERGDYGRSGASRPDAGRFDQRGPDQRSSVGRSDRDRGYEHSRTRDWGPQAGAYGLGVPQENGYASGNRQRESRNQDHDPGYRNWRDRQMESFDRDYDEYRREHQSRFESEFATWRQTRQKQRQSLNDVREHMEVVGSDGGHVGTVDKVKGDRILLTKTDQAAGGHHHSIPSAWIVNVTEKIEISKTADQAHAAWRDEERNLENERDQGGSGGPHILDRSFRGTY
jgi:hypothetical protein